MHRQESYTEPVSDLALMGGGMLLFRGKTPTLVRLEGRRCVIEDCLEQAWA